ncbi:MAG TPA: 3-methyl-2-oxobutanoate hydroxymethyltransferase [Candidatus Limnocylindrales bacterium]|nr:3-methyl-2-oxobutanoate hydroxymethyltransferase [Candidatus Limnocylindrales bacterium]
MAACFEEAKVTVPAILAAKGERKLAMVTAYDFTFARLADRAGADLLLVGDSLGMVMQGCENTLSVTMDEMVYHTCMVARGHRRALVVGDMPFLSYQVSVADAVANAGRLIKEGGAEAVKLEGGVHVAETVARIAAMDIPVMGHIGLTPQSVHRMGGHKVQGRKPGREAGGRERLLEDALALEDAGAFAVVIEGVPADLAAEITAELTIPTIGIGAGVHCDGQVLVLHDVLGLEDRLAPKFVKRYAELGSAAVDAMAQYVDEVRAAQFPTPAHSFSSPRAVALAKEA